MEDGRCFDLGILAKAFSTFHSRCKIDFTLAKKLSLCNNRFKECAKATFSRRWKLNDKNIIPKIQ